MTDIVIDSVSKYLEVLKNKDLANAYYRGEPRKYDNIAAACYRNNFADYDNFIIEDMIEDYFFNMSEQLTDLEKQNFLAYSQHHGLPTNLLDITLNSLVALYFASSNNEDDVGYVHIFKEDRFIECQKLISGTKIDYIYNSILEKTEARIIIFEALKNNYLRYRLPFLDKLEEIINQFIEVKNPVGIKLDEKELSEVKVAFRWFKSNKKSIVEDPDKIKKLTETMLKENKSENLTCWRNIYRNIDDALVDHGKKSYFRVDIIIKVYLATFIYLLNHSYNYNYELPNFPLILYKPDASFDRMKLQSGRFIYQNVFYWYLNDYVRNNNVCHYTQKIIPDFSIKISNKANILKELDLIGINKLTLFNDPDNIADYIYKKHKNKKTNKNLYDDFYSIYPIDYNN